jgi:hypothetical protein
VAGVTAAAALAAACATGALRNPETKTTPAANKMENALTAMVFE